MKIQTCYHMIHSASKLMFTYIQPGERRNHSQDTPQAVTIITRYLNF